MTNNYYDTVVESLSRFLKYYIFIQIYVIAFLLKISIYKYVYTINFVHCTSFYTSIINALSNLCAVHSSFIYPGFMYAQIHQ